MLTEDPYRKELLSWDRQETQVTPTLGTGHSPNIEEQLMDQTEEHVTDKRGSGVSGGL